jgi:hypothetical protein
MTEGSAMFMMANKEMARVVQQAAAGVKSGAIDSEQAVGSIALNLNKSAMAMDRENNARNFSALALTNQGGAMMETVKKTFPGAQRLEKALDSITKIFNDFKKLNKPEDTLTKAMLDIEEATQKLGTSLSTIATNITKSDLAKEMVLDPITSLAKATAELAQLGVDVTKGWNNVPEIGARLQEIFKDLFPDIVLKAVRALSPPEKKAVGGPINAGGSYIVGESGPELITPRQSGFVTPSSKLFALITDSMEDMISSTGLTSLALRNQTLAMQAKMDKFSSIIKLSTDSPDKSEFVPFSDKLLALMKKTLGSGVLAAKEPSEPSDNKLLAFMKELSPAKESIGSPAPDNKLFASINSDVTKMIEEIKSFGTVVTQDAALTAMQQGTKTDAMLTARAAAAPASDSSLRNQQVDDAILALPGLLMDNTAAVIKSSEENADSLHDLRAVVA